MSDEVSAPCHTVLLGAEGFVDLENVDWMVQASKEDEARFIEMKCKGDRERYLSLLLDRNNRPYYLVTLLPDAPDTYLRRAAKSLRVMRLDDG